MPRVAKSDERAIDGTHAKRSTVAFAVETHSRVSGAPKAQGWTAASAVAAPSVIPHHNNIMQ